MKRIISKVFLIVLAIMFFVTHLPLVGFTQANQESIICQECGAENPLGTKFCKECGNKIVLPKPKMKTLSTTEIKCPECGTINPPRTKFCKECGYTLSKIAKPRKRTSRRESVKKERVTSLPATGGGDSGEGGSSSDTSKYGFETDAQGWQHQTYTGSQAITDVEQTTTQAKNGSGSLKCTVELITLDENKSKGEAWVDMNNFPPRGVTPPVNLDNVQISCWVMVGSWAVNETHPNGLQLFVKDTSWNGWYSTWRNITAADVGTWIQLTATVTNTPPPGGWMKAGFDPSKISGVGVKIGANSSGTPGKEFAGDMFIDSFNW